MRKITWGSKPKQQQHKTPAIVESTEAAGLVANERGPAKLKRVRFAEAHQGPTGSTLASPGTLRRWTSVFTRTKPRSPSPTCSDQSWEHHPSYYPEYQPTTAAVPAQAANPWTEAVQTAADCHGPQVGHSVAIHYPVLPRFEEYKESQKNWKSPQWGCKGWNGYAWEGNKAVSTQEGKNDGAGKEKQANDDEKP